MNSFLIIIGLLLATCSYCEIVPSRITSSRKQKPLVDFSDETSIRKKRLTKVDKQNHWTETAQSLGGRIIIQQGADLSKPATLICAFLTPQMLLTGTEPRVTIPNMQKFQDEFNGAGARCQIIGAQLGGAGDVQANLFPCFQRPFNNRVMLRYEKQVRRKLEEGKKVHYMVELEYGNEYYPDSVRMRAVVISERELFNVRIENTPAAHVTNATKIR